MRYMSAGVPFVPSAGEYNDAIDAGRDGKGKRLGDSPGAVISPINPCTIKIRNDVGSNLAAGSVVEVSSSLLTTLDRQHLWFSGIARNGACPPFAVLLEDIPDGAIGTAQAGGVMLATVDVQDAQNTHARVVPGSITLKGDFGGPVELLKAPSGTGSQTLPVRIGARQSIIRRAKADDDIAAGDSGDVSVWIDGADVGTVTAYNDWDADAITANDEIRILYHHDLDRWEIIKRGGGGTASVDKCHIFGSIGASGKAYQDGSSTADGSPTPTITTSGLWLFPSAVGTTSNSLGTVFATPTPTGYSDDAIEVSQPNIYIVRMHVTWLLPPVTQSNARTLFRVAGHTHTYTDNGSGMTTGTTTPDARSIDDGGLVSVSAYVVDAYSGSAYFVARSTCAPWYGSADWKVMSMSGMWYISSTFTLRNIRFKVLRDDSTSYTAPLFGGATFECAQTLPPYT